MAVPTAMDDEGRWQPKRRTATRAPLTLVRAGAAPVTTLLCIATAVMSVGALNAGAHTWEGYAKWGYLAGSAVWSGKWWGLFSSTLVHAGWLHLIFNLYWCWVLGSHLEPLLGRLAPLKFLGLVTISAFVSSALQLAVSGSTGLGLSGVVYAIFGCAWAIKKHEPKLNAIVDTGTIRIFLIWLVLCVVLTLSKVWIVGNTAHVAGLATGYLLGSAALPRQGARRPAALALLVTGTAAALVTLVWAPWSPEWLSMKAYQAHEQKRYAEAISLYSSVIAKQPENAWAWGGRSVAKQHSGDSNGAQTDWATALKLDPTLTVPASN